MKDLRLQDGRWIDGRELIRRVSRSSGPGGQHVNRTNTRVSVGWKIRVSQCLSEEDKAFLILNLKDKINKQGEVWVHVSEYRSQHLNEKAALERLCRWIQEALQRPVPRKPTRIPKSVHQKRLKAKKLRSEVKKMRKKPIEF